VWQASGQGEARDIEREMGEIAKEIHIAPDLTQIIQPPSQSSFCGGGESGPLKVAFLSRISRMKNLDYALTILAKVRLQVQFSIYGVIDDCTYWEECLRMIENLPGNISVAYEGEVPHHEVTSVMAKHDLFFLPTRGENFGHAIYEALASGIPVLISDQTPWRNLQKVGVGWDFPLSLPQAFISVIENQGELDQSQRAAQRLRAIEYARSINNDAQVIEQNRDLFHKCLST
jgi:glycosyltransferase involved in cell wall biosynthesis